MDRRTFLKRVGVMGTALLGSMLPHTTHTQAPAVIAAAPDGPNILIIIVDQLRYPQWFPGQAALDQMLPGLARLRAGAVSFGEHFTAANACTPSRACLVTGLYAHQTVCLLTTILAEVPDLVPGFPTWGHMLRGLGYKTYWYGKWHLSESCDLEPYGFGGGTCPSPDGAAGQGLAADPGIVDQFVAWLQTQSSGPWCTTVSLVNPHDITWYHRLSDQVPGEKNSPSVFTTLPPNFETPSDLAAQSKPRLQRTLQQISAIYNGYMAFEGTNFEERWLKMLDLYLQLQQYVDAQIERLLDALEAKQIVADNTIIIFTADHGEYAGSHGLRGKAGATYDEATRIPLYVKDPTGQFIAHPEIERAQLTSSVDIAPLLLTLATGSNSWRELAQYEHLADRLDLAAIVRDPNAAGRPYILHTTDEDIVDKAPKIPGIDSVPFHVIGLRTAMAKIGVYSFWEPGSLAILTEEQESECYDYSTQAGRQELVNVGSPDNALYSQLHTLLLDEAIPHELRNPLPAHLLPAQQAALQAYLKLELPKVYLPLVAQRR